MDDLIEQRTDEWFLQRLGKVTASRVGDVLAKTKSGYSASRDNYMAQLVVERISKVQTEFFTNSAMQWGIDQEEFARAAYESAKNVIVDEAGFAYHPRLGNAGASPDGYVGDYGLVEIKCPNTSTMIDTLLTENVPQKYFSQMQFQMACTKRDWCDYIVFDSRMPKNAQLFIKRIGRDDDFIEKMEREVEIFLVEVENKVNQIQLIIESKA
tara:strand:- start:1568 stop:2200 length:633 start_codon:yes stop_codon:yes gene_type:complete